jgi:hypothetical protein
MNPIIKQTFGCLSMLYITISLYISYRRSSVNRGSNIFLMATGVPLSVPLCITEKPPYEICSPISISLSSISLTPATYGNLPADTDTLPAVEVNAEKLDFCTSLFKFSISSSIFFFSFFSCFNSSYTSLTFCP